MAKSPAVYSRFLGLALASIVFTCASIVVWIVYVVSTVDHAADRIATDAVPSIVLLAQARSELRIAQTGLAGYLEGASGEEHVRREHIDGALHRLADDLERYHALPIFPGEGEIWPELQGDAAEVGSVAHRILTLDPAARKGSSTPLIYDLRSAADTLDAALARTIHLDASAAVDQSRQIAGIHRYALPVALMLSLIGLVVAAFAIRTARHLVEDALCREHLARDELERRAGELEAFSSRVAHDLLSPLMTVGLALNVAEKRLGPDAKEQTGAVLARATRSLDGVRALVDGLLQFARAGAHPGPGDRTDACEIVQSVVDDNLPAAQNAGIELQLAACQPTVVACSRGILISLVSNLIQNAIKVLDERGGDARRIAVRLRQEPPFARFEVEDTGPGIAPEHQVTIFEPHVRGPIAGRSGFGLGLATVKRLAESSGGQVGVESEPGRGALFWFTLPFAGKPAGDGTLVPQGGV